MLSLDHDIIFQYILIIFQKEDIFQGLSWEFETVGANH